jgi:hypothetical protein
VPFVVAGIGIVPDGVESFDETAAKVSGYGMVEATELVGMING